MEEYSKIDQQCAYLADGNRSTLSRETNMRCALLWTHISLLLILILNSADLTASRSCPTHCGRILIPYPFGVGKGCYLNEWFEIQCNSSTSGELVPYLIKINKQVVRIDLPVLYASLTPPFPYGSLKIRTSIMSTGCSNKSSSSSSRLGRIFGEPLDFTGSPFTIGRSNKLVAVGCDNMATLTNLEPRLVGCISSCGSRKKGDKSSCNGYRCCQADTPEEVGHVIGVSIENNPPIYTSGWRGAFITDEFNENSRVFPVAKLTDPLWFYNRQYVTVQLRWVIPMMHLSFIKSLGCEDVEVSKRGNDSIPCLCFNATNYDIPELSCICKSGTKGNPYHLDGCTDIDECQLYKRRENFACGETATCVNNMGGYDCVEKKNKTLPIVIGFSVGIGVLVFVGVSFWLYKFIKSRRKLNRKRKYFKRNGGLLLQQQLISNEGRIKETIVFNSKELEKATENFSLNRVLGQGGQGTVYKGMLEDGRIVAVKKSKVVDEDKLEEFINEVVILSQINHRNIVKLLGCCLETNVPLLVYEFIPNGNLFEHLHDQFDDYTMTTWEVRLRIAIDIAGALSYLHSAASSPIYHRDIKSTNIMLDEKYRAKVSDFGTSRSVTVDHTHLTTVVSGTVGYVDPEYFQSSQFTDKSDVYSFGVVLVELITGEKPVSFLRSQENRTLATYFILAVKEDKLVNIIDPRIRDDCKLEQVMAAAVLARRCLNLNGKKRPSMREVSMELERIRSPTGGSQSQAHIVDNDLEDAVAVELNIGVQSSNYVGVTAPAKFQDDVGSTSDAQPLCPRQTW
uniref:Protein kinase domain-containing protein n=1 Tax=Brassica campestris TaxID=3711 RepID=M4DFT8_BRACM